MQKDRLVSAKALREKLREFEEQTAKEHQPFLPEYMRTRDAWMLAEFGRMVREAEQQQVGTGEASDLTGWDQQTLRKYCRAVVEGTEVPAQWSGLLATRDGRDYAIVLSTIPVHPSRRALAS